ncbi:MAG: hypothetical protein V3U54_11780 [Thermodesulfobacteriota bacterium]
MKNKNVEHIPNISEPNLFAGSSTKTRNESIFTKWEITIPISEARMAKNLDQFLNDEGIAFKNFEDLKKHLKKLKS